jgi:cobyrinic acid a,c-diamide synthase
MRALMINHAFRWDLLGAALALNVCYLALGQWLEDAEGVKHRMAGLLGHATSFARRKLQLGYRQARLLADGEGKALGPAGGRRGGVTGTFFHAVALS